MHYQAMSSAMSHATERIIQKVSDEVIAKEIEEKMKRFFLCDYEKW
jgi:hypothetical protein